VSVSRLPAEAARQPFDETLDAAGGVRWRLSGGWRQLGSPLALAIRPPGSHVTDQTVSVCAICEPDRLNAAGKAVGARSPLTKAAASEAEVDAAAAAPPAVPPLCSAHNEIIGSPDELATHVTTSPPPVGSGEWAARATTGMQCASGTTARHRPDTLSHSRIEPSSEPDTTQPEASAAARDTTHCLCPRSVPRGAIGPARHRRLSCSAARARRARADGRLSGQRRGVRRPTTPSMSATASQARAASRTHRLKWWQHAPRARMSRTAGSIASRCSSWPSSSGSSSILAAAARRRAGVGARRGGVCSRCFTV
jgi:hypothetical protein